MLTNPVGRSFSMSSRSSDSLALHTLLSVGLANDPCFPLNSWLFDDSLRGTMCLEVAPTIRARAAVYIALLCNKIAPPPPERNWVRTLLIRNVRELNRMYCFQGVLLRCSCQLFVRVRSSTNRHEMYASAPLGLYYRV